MNQTSSTEASAVVGDNLNEIIASTEQQQPLLPEFQTVVDGAASNTMFSDETVEQIFKNALLENTNENNNNPIGINYLASDTPFFYGHEYEVYTDGAGASVCRLVEQKVTSVSERSETAISYTIGESSSACVGATTSKTNVAEEDEAKPSCSSRHDEESITNESNEGSQSEGYNLKLPENYTPESFVSTFSYFN